MPDYRTLLSFCVGVTILLLVYHCSTASAKLSSTYCRYHPEDSLVCGEERKTPLGKESRENEFRIKGSTHRKQTVDTQENESDRPPATSQAKHRLGGDEISTASAELVIGFLVISLVSVSLWFWSKRNKSSSSSSNQENSDLMALDVTDGANEEALSHSSDNEHQEADEKEDEEAEKEKEKEEEPQEADLPERDEEIESFEVVQKDDEGGEPRTDQLVAHKIDETMMADIVVYLKKGLQEVDVDMTDLSSAQKTELVVKAVELGIKHRSMKEKSSAFLSSSHLEISKLQEKKRANKERELERSKSNQRIAEMKKESLRLQLVQQREQMREKTFSLIWKVSLALVMGVWLSLLHWKVGMWHILERMADGSSNWLYQWSIPYQSSSIIGGIFSHLAGYLLVPIFYALVFVAIGAMLYLSGSQLLQVLSILLAAVVFGSSVARGLCYYVPLFLAQWLALLLLPPDSGDFSYRLGTGFLLLVSVACSLCIGWSVFLTDPLNPYRIDGWIDSLLRYLPLS